MISQKEINAYYEVERLSDADMVYVTANDRIHQSFADAKKTIISSKLSRRVQLWKKNVDNNKSKQPLRTFLLDTFGNIIYNTPTDYNSETLSNTSQPLTLWESEENKEENRKQLLKKKNAKFDISVSFETVEENGVEIPFIFSTVFVKDIEEEKVFSVELKGKKVENVNIDLGQHFSSLGYEIRKLLLGS